MIKKFNNPNTVKIPTKIIMSDKNQDKTKIGLKHSKNR